MNQKSISCVIPTHNRDKFLKEAIYSVINQTYSPLEIIISDNIPSKNTKSIVESIAEKSPVPISYIGHNMEGRSSISMNLAVSRSKGDYIAFLNDDDAWEVDYLKKISQLITNKKSKIIYTWLIDWHNNIKYQGKQIESELEIKDFLLRNPGCVISNLVLERKLFIGLGGFDEYIHPSNDKDLIIRALYFGYTYDVLRDSLVLLRRHANGREADINKDFLIGMKKFFKKHEFNASLKIKLKFWYKYWKLYIKSTVLLNNK